MDDILDQVVIAWHSYIDPSSIHDGSVSRIRTELEFATTIVPPR